jgi:L-asparaginase
MTDDKTEIVVKPSNQRRPASELTSPDVSHGSDLSVLIINEKSAPNNSEIFDFKFLPRIGLPRFEVLESAKFQSADHGPDDWKRIANLIEEHYHRHCGFIVYCGTDGMVYTASALSFMLQNLGKPVIFTGSLISGTKSHSDLHRNLILSIIFAASTVLCEVCIVFAEKLLRANRCIKTSSVSLQPFESPFLPPLASMRANVVQFEEQDLLPAPSGRLTVYTDMHAQILTVKLTPGVVMEAMLRLVNDTTARAIVVCAFGSGNVPLRGKVMAAFALRARDRGIIVAVCTQNRFGYVDLQSYETGRQLVETGVVETRDMTLETTIVKLKYLLGRGYSLSTIRKMLVTPLVGEISLKAASKI